MATPNTEQVRYDILIEAKAALQVMREMLKYTEDNRVKIMQFSKQVLEDSRRWGVSWKQALDVYRQLNSELAKSRKPTLFGNVGGQNLFKMSEDYLTSLDQAGRLQEKVKVGAEELGKSVEGAGRRGAMGMHFLRIALGAIEAMFIFRLINAVETFFRGAIEQAKQFEDTLYRLRNVEESLSMQGIEITMKGLKEGIKDIQETLPIFSKEDVAQLVGSLAISTKQLGLNEEQILDLARAIGILNIRSEKQESLTETGQRILSSLLTGNAKGISSLGIAFTDNLMRAEAMRLKFLEAGESLSELTENEKGIVKLNIVLASTANESANISEYLESNSAKIQENSAAWKDLQTTVGQILLPFVPTLTTVFELLNTGFHGAKVILIETIGLVATLGVTLAAVLTGRVTSFEQVADLIRVSMDTFRKTLVNTFFNEVPENAPDWFMKGWGKHIKEEAETATGPVQDLGDAIESLDLSELENKIEEIIEDAENAREDLKTDLDRKLADLDEEYRRKNLDAEKDYNRKVEDINRDFERDIADLKEKHRQEDLRDEEEYQLKLWELQQRFLMNLEDALHARDARQILRLMKQYKIDKEALERKHALDEKAREDSQQAEIEDLELKRQQRLEDARLEYEQKLADLNVAKQREQEDLNTWYEREQADIELAMQRKLETLLKSWVDEKKITEANAAEVYGILAKYFGPGGLTDALYKYMTDSMVAAAVNAANAINTISGPFDSVVGESGLIPSEPEPSTGTTGGMVKPPKKHANKKGYAEGGTLIATRPTQAVFGESGPERVDITPLARPGNNIGRIFGDRAAAGMDGRIALDILLSPDLEARVIENSLNGVAEVITRVQRAKL